MNSVSLHAVDVLDAGIANRTATREYHVLASRQKKLHVAVGSSRQPPSSENFSSIVSMMACRYASCREQFQDITSTCQNLVGCRRTHADGGLADARACAAESQLELERAWPKWWRGEDLAGCAGHACQCAQGHVALSGARPCP